jgi:hypothetical protein
MVERLIGLARHASYQAVSDDHFPTKDASGWLVLSRCAAAKSKASFRTPDFAG